MFIPRPKGEKRGTHVLGMNGISEQNVLGGKDSGSGGPAEGSHVRRSVTLSGRGFPSPS